MFKKLIAIALVTLFSLSGIVQASEISDTWERSILDAILNQTNITAPTTIHMSLHTTATTDACGGTEVSGNGYARVAATTGFPAASGTTGAVSSNATLSFPAASGGNWGTVSHTAIYDAASAGNCIVYTALDASKAVNDGDTASFASGDVTLTIAFYELIDEVNKVVQLPTSPRNKVEMLNAYLHQEGYSNVLAFPGDKQELPLVAGL